MSENISIDKGGTWIGILGEDEGRKPLADATGHSYQCGICGMQYVTSKLARDCCSLNTFNPSKDPAPEPTPLTEEQKNQVKPLVEQGYTYSEVRKMLGLEPKVTNALFTIAKRKIMKERGITCSGNKWRQ